PEQPKNFPLSSIAPLHDGHLAIAFSFCCLDIVSVINFFSFIWLGISLIIFLINAFICLMKTSCEPLSFPILSRYSSHFAVFLVLDNNIPSITLLTTSQFLV